MKELALVAFAGAVGTLARFGLSSWVQKLGGIKFPWATLAVNLIGCLLFGLVFALAEERHLISARLRLILLTGFMGAFTTFSSFGFETATLLRNEQWMIALANVAAQNILGIGAVFLGLSLGRAL
jgi:fluoride exporter